MPRAKRGEVWLVDLGFVAKVRPGLVISVEPEGQERVLFTIVPHTTSRRGTRFEVDILKPFLRQGGAFDVQGLINASAPSFIKRLGALAPDELSRVEDAVKVWLGLR